MAQEGIVPFTSTITPDLSAYGEAVSYPGQGEYQIYLDTDNSILDKPIILIDGFDPGDGRDIDGIYELLSYPGAMGTENLADFVRSQGFDVVIFNSPVYTRAADLVEVDGGADFIERNAMLLVDLINTINAAKIGNEQNVIIGPSMGGLISRYALNYMENNALDHDTRLWLSFDAPHHGANIPLGLQHQFNYLAYGLDDNSVTQLQALVEAQLKSPAARQMLIDHFESHLENGSNVEFDVNIVEPVAHPWRTIFMNDMNSLTADGFPQDTRNVAMTNGSGIGSPYQDKNGADILPGFNVIDETLDVAPLTTAEIEVNFTPSTTASAVNPVRISKIQVELDLIIFPPTILYESEAFAKAPSYTDGVDAAPGGLFDIGGLTEDLDLTGLTGEFVDALTTDFFSFIPTVSALALESTNNEVDWYHDIDLGPGDPPGGIANGRSSNDTPFVNWYMPGDNEPHVDINAANVAFALSEIITETLNISSFELTELRLERNPITSDLVLLNNVQLNNASLEIVDLTGKTVYKMNTVNISNRTRIPVSLSSGLYILNVRSRNNFNKRIKFVVK